ncbi:MAG: 3-oxoacid CoA-transferase subunit B [Tissierellia bacterium]|nr:3-oxoacid CoA-transferase subunit B [Tissierellia bacterium]
MVLDKKARKQYIAKRVAQELHDGDVVNLGIGLPTMVADYVPEDIQVVLHAELGYAGAGPAPKEGEEDPYIIDSGGTPATIQPYGCFFDSPTSFGLIRGGHVNITVLGALQVAANGDIANYMIPGKLVPGMGGAMDLVEGAEKVIVAMDHTNKGNPKIFEECSLPLTGKGCVDMIVTEMGVMEVTEEGLVLTELAEGVSFDDIQAATAAKLIKGPGIE